MKIEGQAGGNCNQYESKAIQAHNCGQMERFLNQKFKEGWQLIPTTITVWPDGSSLAVVFRLQVTN